MIPVLLSLGTLWRPPVLVKGRDEWFGCIWCAGAMLLVCRPEEKDSSDSEIRSEGSSSIPDSPTQTGSASSHHPHKLYLFNAHVHLLCTVQCADILFLCPSCSAIIPGYSHAYVRNKQLSRCLLVQHALRQPSKRQCPCVGALHRDRTASGLACVQYGRLVMVCDVRAGSRSRQQGALRRGRGRPRACGRCRGMAWGKPRSTLAPSSPAPTPASACESSPSATPLPPDQRSSV